MKMMLEKPPSSGKVRWTDCPDRASWANKAAGKISDLLALLAENRMQVRVDGLADSPLMESLQKIANRISAGLVTAALIVASAMMMRVQSDTRLLGYPAIALVLFVVAAGLGIAIVLSALLRDRKARPREERGPR